VLVVAIFLVLAGFLLAGYFLLTGEAIVPTLVFGGLSLAFLSLPGLVLGGLTIVAHRRSLRS